MIIHSCVGNSSPNRKVASDSRVNSRLQSTPTRAPSNRSQSRTNKSPACGLSKNAALRRPVWLPCIDIGRSNVGISGRRTDGLQKRQVPSVTQRHFVRSDRCLTSPALRACQTAEALLLDATVEPALRDCDYGRWAGLSFDHVQTKEPAALADWLCDPAAAPHGGEAILSLIERVGAWLDAQSGIPGKTVAITHASVIRAAVVHAIGAPPQSFWRIDIAPLSITSLSGTRRSLELSIRQLHAIKRQCAKRLRSLRPRRKALLIYSNSKT